MSESTDNPTPDVEALTALEKAATPAPWEAQMVQPNMAGNHQWYLHPVPRRPAGVHATGRGEDIDLIVAMRNQLPALLAELARVTAKRDEWRRSCDHAGQAITEIQHRLNALVDERTLERNTARQEAEYWKGKYEGAVMDQMADATTTAAPKAACGHQHARFLRQPGDQPILCTLPAEHDGDHGEPETRSHWDRNSNFGYVATGDPRALKPAVAVPGAGSGETTGGEVARG